MLAASKNGEVKYRRVEIAAFRGYIRLPPMILENAKLLLAYVIMSRQKAPTSKSHSFLHQHKHETNITARPCRYFLEPLDPLSWLTNEPSGTVLDSDQVSPSSPQTAAPSRLS